MSENRSKIGVYKGVGQYPPNFRVEGTPMPYNIVADNFHTKKLCSRLCSN